MAETILGCMGTRFNTSWLVYEAPSSLILAWTRHAWWEIISLYCMQEGPDKVFFTITNKPWEREFQGIVGRSSLNKSVALNSSTTQLSLSCHLSKSKTTTIPAISFFRSKQLEKRWIQKTFIIFLLVSEHQTHEEGSL